MGRSPKARVNVRTSPMGTRPSSLPKVRLGVESDKDPLLNGGFGDPPLGKIASRDLNNKRLKEALIEVSIPMPTKILRKGWRVTHPNMCIAVDCDANSANIGRWFQFVSYSL